MDTTLCARVERCLCSYVEWEIQILKWMKLDELERQVKKLEVSGVVGYRKLGRKLNLFISSWEETKENLELELSSVLSTIGVDKSSAGVATTISADVAPNGGSHLVDDASGCSL